MATPQVSIDLDQVLVVVAAAAVTADDVSVTNLDVVNAYSGVTIYQKYHYLWNHRSYIISSYVFGILRMSRRQEGGLNKIIF